MICVVLAALSALGPVVKFEGGALRPPAGFRSNSVDLFTGSRALTAAPAGVRASVVAAFVDGDGTDATSIAVAVVDAPFLAGGRDRDDLALHVVRELRDDAEMRFALESVELVAGPTARAEVFGTLKGAGQIRGVLVAAFAGSPRHVTVTASFPLSRAAEAKAALAEAFASFANDDPQRKEPPTWAVGILALALLFLLVGSVALRGRRRQ